MSGYKLVRYNSASLSCEVILVFLLGIFVSTIGLCHHEFVEFEARFGLFAQEMLRNGISFFPTTYNKFYPDYPATQTILTYLFSLLNNRITIFTAVLPTAIASALTLVFTYLIGITQNKTWGWYAVLLSLFTFAFLSTARTISLDQFSTAATACSFYSAYTAKLYQKPQRLWLLPLSFLLGFAFRGPIGLIIPASVVCGFYLLEQDIKALALTIMGSVLLLLLCLFGLLAAAHHDGGQQLVKEVIKMQALGRMGVSNEPPFYYYLKTVFTNYAITFPIACVIWLCTIKSFWRTPPDQTLRLLRHLGFWLLIVLIGMSIPGDKKIRYILPITPAIALCAAYLFSVEHQQKLLLQLRLWVIRFCIALPYLGLITVLMGLIISHIKHINLGIYYISAIVLFCLQIIIGIIKKYKNYSELSNFIIGLAAFITFYTCIAQPIAIEFNQAKPFVAQVESLRQAQQTLVFYKIGPDGDDIKYMVALDKPLNPLFLQDSTELINFKSLAIFIATPQNFFALPKPLKNNLKILFIKNLGHQPYVVFTSKSTAVKTVSKDPA